MSPDLHADGAPGTRSEREAVQTALVRLVRLKTSDTIRHAIPAARVRDLLTDRGHDAMVVKYVQARALEDGPLLHVNGDLTHRHNIVRCPTCHAPNAEKAPRCEHCGADLANTSMRTGGRSAGGGV